ncbi:hypothetical protein CIPAW_06G056600 [Carya illinoinensis]|uniref:Uncharacterized protein n=1 Tax=Carya illinoinensis TaxID=32201 RepID=A0A8T1Q897_CARIL|nr:hypothetical protein CIPAW_06G056600 [Carya illinoinensis]KAG6707929.1 hypothetical protein I3842_06G055800 [Carya illinoinensis]
MRGAQGTQSNDVGLSSGSMVIWARFSYEGCHCFFALTSMFNEKGAIASATYKAEERRLLEARI